MYFVTIRLVNEYRTNVDVYFEPTGEAGPTLHPKDELVVRYSSDKQFYAPLVVKIRDDEFRVYEPDSTGLVDVQVWVNDKFIDENSY